MMRSFFLYMSESQSWRDRVSRWKFSRRFARRFIAGETLDEALEAVRRLNDAGVMATLDFLGENVRNRDEALEAAAAYRAILTAIRDHGLQSNISVKLTQLGLDLDRRFCQENLLRLVDFASDCGLDIEVDMEASAYTEATLDIVCAVREHNARVGVAIQAYLRRSEADIRRMIDRTIKVRLVKGAYKEPPEIAYQKKREVNRNFDRLMRLLFDSGQYHAIATHDPARIEAARRYALSIGRSPDSFEFQMLYGIRRDLQAMLVREGYRMRVYVPYGTHWYPYFMRRLAERPANVFFILRHLFR